MKRGLVALALMAAATASSGPQARANVNSSGWGQDLGLVSWYDPSTGSYGAVFVNAYVSASQSGTTVTPSSSWTAYGYSYICTPGCVSTSHPSQAVPPTAFTMDPVGNTARLQFSFTGPAPLAVDLTLSRPQTLSVSPSPPRLNAWVDPSTNSAEASLSYGGLFIERQNYTVTGSWGAMTLAPCVCGATYRYASTSGPVVDVP